MKFEDENIFAFCLMRVEGLLLNRRNLSMLYLHYGCFAGISVFDDDEEANADFVFSSRNCWAATMKSSVCPRALLLETAQRRDTTPCALLPSQTVYSPNCSCSQSF